MREAGLSLSSLEIKSFDCPHANIRHETGDVKMAAKTMAEEIRAWSNSTFLSGLIMFYLYFKSHSKCFFVGFGYVFASLIAHVNSNPKK